LASVIEESTAKAIFFGCPSVVRASVYERVSETVFTALQLCSRCIWAYTVSKNVVSIFCNNFMLTDFKNSFYVENSNKLSTK